MEETDIQSRLDRAESRETTFNCVAFDPLVYTVETDHSDTVHTIVPDILHCSCADATYRDGPCYHLLAMAMQESHAGGTVRDALESKRDGAQSAVDFYKDNLQQKQDELTRLQTALDGINERAEPSDPEYTLELGSKENPVDTGAIDTFAEELGVESDDSESESKTTEQPRDEQGRFLSPTADNESTEPGPMFGSDEDESESQFEKLVEDLKRGDRSSEKDESHQSLSQRGDGGDD